MYSSIKKLQGKMDNFTAQSGPNATALPGYEVFKYVRIDGQVLNNVMVENGLALALRDAKSEVEIEVLTMESLIKNQQDLIYIVSATIDGKVIDRRAEGVAAANVIIDATKPAFKIANLMVLLGVIAIPVFGIGVLILMFVIPMRLMTLPPLKRQIKCIEKFKSILDGEALKEASKPVGDGTKPFSFTS